MDPDVKGIKPGLDDLLSTLDARVRALAICKVGDGVRLVQPAMEVPLLHFVMEGRGWIGVDANWKEIARGCLVIVPPNRTHVLATEPRGGRDVESLDLCIGLTDGMLEFGENEDVRLKTTCAAVSADYFGVLGFFDSINEPLVIDHDEVSNLPGVFGEMLDEVSSAELGAKAVASALMKKALIYVVRQELKHPDKGSWLVALDDPKLGRAVMAIIESRTKALNVDQLADLAGMSRSAFSRKFTESFGVSPNEFQQEVRLRRAASILSQSKMPVSVVASAVGYESRSHFSRLFKKRFGIEPSQFSSQNASEEKSVVAKLLGI